MTGKTARDGLNLRIGLPYRAGSERARQISVNLTVNGRQKTVGGTADQLFILQHLFLMLSRLILVYTGFVDLAIAAEMWLPTAISHFWSLFARLHPSFSFA
jgi:hypothetical protein